MLDQLLNFISKQKLLSPGQKVLLAVSGGIDSMVLVHLFHDANVDFAIAHCNFQLRGKDSDGDQQLVETSAEKHKVLCFIKAFETEKHAKKHGISIQMAARNLRREWFAEVMEKEGFSVIATAHHINDGLETVLFNLAKGTGIAGLRGILPKKENYIRPLMFASRDQIHEYAKAHDIKWREDKSNSSTKYHRNRIRHKVVPELRHVNPNLEQTLVQSLEKIRAVERIYKRAINHEKSMLLEPTMTGFQIDIEKLKAVADHKIILFEILEEYGFNYSQITDLAAAIDGQPGKSFYSPTHDLVIDRTKLIVMEKASEKPLKSMVEEQTPDLVVGKTQLIFEQVVKEEVKFTDDRNVAFMDFDRLSFPLCIRTWQPGDRFQPLGMQHKKKLSDFMIDEKIPLNLKKQVLVLLSGKDVVWVVGHRIDDRYKITEHTKNIFKISNINIDDKPI